jgi:hypothetical protein
VHLPTGDGFDESNIQPRELISPTTKPISIEGLIRTRLPRLSAQVDRNLSLVVEGTHAGLKAYADESADVR